MATKSNNTTGNPYHDEGNGQFTSADGSGEKKQEPQKMQNSVPTAPTTMGAGFGLKQGANLNGLMSQLKSGQGVKKDLGDLMGKLKDINQVSNIPHLQSARDIENHIEQFFSKSVTENLNKLYGSTPDCAHYQFHPKSNPRMVLDIFPNVIGKFRYKDNHATVLSSRDFIEFERKNRNAYGMDKVYRGISSSGSKATSIIRNYGTLDLNNFDYYCPASTGNCYGSNVYTTVQYSYASGYVRGRGTLIEGYVDKKNSWYMYSSDVDRIRSSLNLNNIQVKVEAQLVKNGLDQSRANKISKAFSNSLSRDVGMVAICMGLDFFIATGQQHQRNLFNLSKWVIKDNV